MTIKYFVSPKNIPDDGSKKIIENFVSHIDSEDTDVFIYPDVHYKKGARVANGMLVKSKKYIYPACLGVENCGFTFGKIENASEDYLKQSFVKYAEYLKPYEAIRKCSKKEMLNIFYGYLQKDFSKNSKFYSFLNIKDVDNAFTLAKKCLGKDILKMARRLYGSLGGGNHFFEIHKVVKSFDDNVKTDNYFFILHSDSISVGDRINLRYSNLSELDFVKNTKDGRKYISKTRKNQFWYFLKNGLFFTNPIETLRLIYSQKDYRGIKFNTRLGKRLLFEHNLAKLFGEINRDAIINNWALMNNLDIKIVASHSHDSVSYEEFGGDDYVFQRNGVQYLGEDEIFMLPSAMGNYSYLMKNPKNKQAFLSANHGTGRNQDKHIARECYKENETINDLDREDILFCHIGTGNIAEQSKKAFKDVDIVLAEMKNNNLGEKIAKLKPIAIMKG